MTTTSTTPTTTPTTTATDPRLLTLMQWLSPGFPLGAFAWSHGLETAVAQHWVHNAASLRDWLEDLITHGSLRADATWALRAHASPPEGWAALDAEARAFAAAPERLRETLRQGTAFARLARDIWQIPLPDMVLPVALGAAGGQAGLAPAPLAMAYLHSSAGNLVSAAQRLMPLGQSPAQGVLHDLAPACVDTARALADDPHPQPWSATWGSDIAALRHETQKTRLFQS